MLKDRLGFNGGLHVDSVGKSGGLVLLWDDSVVVDVKSFSNHHINAWAANQDGFMWRFTGIYGFSDFANRHHTLELLERLSVLFTLPWLVGGDFNEVLYASEMEGGSDRRFGSMARFRRTVDDCGLVNLGF